VSDGWDMKGDAKHYFDNNLKETDYKENRRETNTNICGEKNKL
jgi:hypothetical protein